MDYLNPTAMLVPTNANNSFYAPSWDQMVMADTKRGLQADELFSNMNERNASESVREKYKLPADIMKYQQQMAEDEAKTDPAYIQSMIQGKMGENLSSHLKGRMEQDLYDPTLAAGRAGLINKKQDHEWNSKYHQYAKLEDGVAGILNMNIPDPRIRGEKIKEMIRLHGGENMSWLDPKNSMFLEKAAANPEGFLRTIHTQKNLMETQAQMFDMRELYMKHLYSMEEAELKERGANTRAANSDRTTMDRERVAFLKETGANVRLYKKELEDSLLYVNDEILRMERKQNKEEKDLERLRVLKKYKEEASKEYEKLKANNEEVMRETAKRLGLPYTSSAPTAPPPATFNPSGWTRGADGVMRKEVK